MVTRKIDGHEDQGTVTSGTPKDNENCKKAQIRETDGGVVVAGVKCYTDGSYVYRYGVKLTIL